MREYQCVLSKVLISSDHQEEDLALKSHIIIDRVGLRVLMALKNCSKFNKMSEIHDCFSLGSGK